MKKITAYTAVLAIMITLAAGCGGKLTAAKAATAMQKVHDTESSKVEIRYEMSLTSDGETLPVTFLMDIELQTDKRNADEMHSRITGTVETNMMGDVYSYEMETYCVLTEENLKLYSGLDGDWSYEEVLAEERTAVILEIADILGDTAEEVGGWSSVTDGDGNTNGILTTSFGGTVKLSSISGLVGTMTSDLGIDVEEVGDLTAEASVSLRKDTGVPAAYHYDLTDTLSGIFQAYAAEDESETVIQVSYAGCSVTDIEYDGDITFEIPAEAAAAEAAWIEDGGDDDFDEEYFDEEYFDEDEDDPEYMAKLEEIEAAGVCSLTADSVDTVFDITWPEGLAVSYFDEESAQFCVADDMNYLYFTIYEKDLYDLSEGVGYLLEYYLESFESDPEAYTDVEATEPADLGMEYPTEFVDIYAKYMDEEGYHYMIALQEYDDCWMVVEADMLTVSDPAEFLKEAVRGVSVQS